MAAAQTSGVRVTGLRDLNRALKRTDRDMRLGIRAELRSVAEPVRVDAEQLTASSIRNIGNAWSRMRVGITTDSVYVAPRERGLKRGERKRPNLAPLIAEPMEKALDNNADRIEDDLGDVLDRVADNFSR